MKYRLGLTMPAQLGHDKHNLAYKRVIEMFYASDMPISDCSWQAMAGNRPTGHMIVRQK